jgi:type I restriction enzyme S subunit
VIPYAQYKTSGVKWLGDIPNHWTVKSVKRIFRVVNGATPSSGEPSYWDGEITWVTPSDLGRLKSAVIAKSERTLTIEGLSNCGATLVSSDSIILSTRAPIGHVAIAASEFCTNQGCRALEILEDLSTKYFYYLFCLAKKELQSLGSGTTFLELSTSSLSDFKISVPSEIEKKEIVNYLDAEVKRIDSLIKEKNGLIGLLTEAVESYASELISGGTLPSTKSGNEWIPHLPNGWQLKRLKHLGKVRSGIAKGKDTEGRTTIELPYLRVANVQDGYLNLSEISTIEVDEDVVDSYLLQKGDVLMNEGGDYDKVGRGARWDGQISPCIHQNHVFAVRPEDPDMSEWLAAILQTKYAKYYFMNNAKQSTNLASISQSNIKELPILVPPKDVRTKILEQVADEAKKLKDLITHTEGEIELLEELRTATIADAVLGRIDVRTQSHH